MVNKQQYISVSAVIRSITIMMLIVIVSFSVLVGYFLYLIEEGEANDLHVRIESSLNVVAEKELSAAYEYSYWDEAYLNLVQEKNNDWISKNISDYLLPEYNFDFLAVLNADYKFELLSRLQSSVMSADLAQTIQYPDVEHLPHQGIHFYQKINNVMYNILVLPFISEETDQKHKEAMVVGVAMTNDYLSSIAEKFRLPPLRFTADNQTQYRVNLNDYYGETQRALIWDIISPTRRILPYIIGSGLILMLVSFFIVRHVLFKEFHSRAQYEERLYDAATKDDLTKIPSRKFFYDYAETNFRRYLIQNRKFSLLIVDLDHFEQVNDKFGLVTGNQALIQFTKIVRGLLKDNDLFGRIGGDEFAILLPDADVDNVLSLIEKIRKEVKEHPITQEGISDYEMTFSAGLATDELKCATLSELTNKAGVALYEAKKSGMNQTVIARAEL